jgi:hypothetical protein
LKAVSGAAAGVGLDGGAPAVLRGAAGGCAAAHGAPAAGLGRAAQLPRGAARVARPPDARATQAAGQPLQAQTGIYFILFMRTCARARLCVSAGACVRACNFSIFFNG